MKSLKDFINESVVNEVSLSTFRKMWTNEIGVELPKNSTIYAENYKASIKDAQKWWDEFTKTNDVELVQKSKTLEDSKFQNELDNSWIISAGLTITSVEEYKFFSQSNNRLVIASVTKVKEDSSTYVTLRQLFPNGSPQAVKIYNELS